MSSEIMSRSERRNASSGAPTSRIACARMARSDGACSRAVECRVLREQSRIELRTHRRHRTHPVRRARGVVRIERERREARRDARRRTKHVVHRIELRTIGDGVVRGSRCLKGALVVAPRRVRLRRTGRSVERDRDDESEDREQHSMSRATPPTAVRKRDTMRTTPVCEFAVRTRRRVRSNSPPRIVIRKYS